MSPTTGSGSRDIVPSDDRPHEHGGEPGWVERYAFNLFDAASGYGALISLDYTPGDRKASGEVEIFLPGGAVATALARASDAKRAELTVGRITLECTEEMKAWRIRCADVALVFPSAESASLAGKTERAGKAAQIEIDVTFDARAQPAGWGARRTDINDEGFTAIVSSGWFEQLGHYTGRVRVGTDAVDVDASGFRTRGWGVPGGAGFWYAAAFGDDLAVSMGSVEIAGRVDTHGRVYRSGRVFDWRGNGRQSVAANRLDMLLDDVGGQDIHVTADLLATLPPRAGEPEVYRSLARFHLGARETLGLVQTAVLSL